MNMVYDSESFVVVHCELPIDTMPQVIVVGETTAISNDVVLAKTQTVEAPAGKSIDASNKARAQDPNAIKAPKLTRQGFEIVDKRTGKELYLDGGWAELFYKQIQTWQTSTPTQEEVEETLDQYASLAQTPLVLQ